MLTFCIGGSVVTGYARKAMNQIQDITHHPYRAIIEHRIKVISFFNRYGQTATYEAFGVSRSTVYLWQQKLKKNNGRLSALAPTSTAPKHRRKRQTDQTIANFIIEKRQLRHRLGKDKVKPMLDEFCARNQLRPISASTIGRVLRDLKAQGRLPKNGKVYLSGRTGRMIERTNQASLKKRRRGDYRPKVPGDLLQIDTIVKFINGIKRYCVTAVDVHGRFAFAYAYRSPSSSNAADFLAKLQAIAPFEIKRVQTDNGSEFYKYFHETCEKQGIIHFWNYPRSPKMNARVERFNRTIQEEFMDMDLYLMADDLEQWNSNLMDWLIYYNTERPHFALGQISPMRYLINNFGLSNMLWTHTFA